MNELKKFLDSREMGTLRRRVLDELLDGGISEDIIQKALSINIDLRELNKEAEQLVSELDDSPNDKAVSITNIEQEVETVHYIETDGEWPNLYRRCNGVWESSMGESWEPVTRPDELEKLFQSTASADSQSTIPHKAVETVSTSVFAHMLQHSAQRPSSTRVRVEVQAQNGYAITVTLKEFREAVKRED